MKTKLLRKIRKRFKIGIDLNGRYYSVDRKIKCVSHNTSLRVCITNCMYDIIGFGAIDFIVSHHKKENHRRYNKLNSTTTTTT